MKATLILNLVWITTISATPVLEKRQNPFANSPVQKPLRIKEIDGTLKPGSKHVNVLYGPFEVPAGKVRSSMMYIRDRQSNHFAALRKR